MQTQYGRYRIKKQLGRGTMGVVYLAHDPQIDRLVALKVLRPDKVVSEEFVQRFLKEARAIGRLGHPNIVVVYDVGRDHGTIYIAMEYLEGRPFNTVITSGRPDLGTWARVGVQLAQTLAYAHDKGIIHRDIKPSNIIMTQDGQIKLTDFGIARIEDPEATLQTQMGDILGTPAYMAPEQVAGKPVDGRSDLFSLGVILFEWLLGQRPFTGKSMAAIFTAISTQAPPSPQEIDPAVPKPIAGLLLKTLQKAPADRFQDGREMAAAIEEGLGRLRPAEGQAGFQPTRWLRWALAGLCMVAVAGILASPPVVRHMHGWLRSPQPEAPPQAIPPAPPAAGEARPGDLPPPAEEPPATPRAAALKVTSAPAGAQLFIDGVPRGATPLELALPVGIYTVGLTLSAHRPWEAAVELGASGEMPLHVRLSPDE